MAIAAAGWWCNNHLEKYERQWEGLSHILWNIKNVLNHQESSQISFDVPPQTFVDIDQSASDAQLGFSVFRQCLASCDRRLCNAYPLVNELT